MVTTAIQIIAVVIAIVITAAEVVVIALVITAAEVVEFISHNLSLTVGAHFISCFFFSLQHLSPVASFQVFSPAS